VRLLSVLPTICGIFAPLHGGTSLHLQWMLSHAVPRQVVQANTRNAAPLIAVRDGGTSAHLDKTKGPSRSLLWRRQNHTSLAIHVCVAGHLNPQVGACHHVSWQMIPAPGTQSGTTWGPTLGIPHTDMHWFCQKGAAPPTHLHAISPHATLTAFAGSHPGLHTAPSCPRRQHLYTHVCSALQPGWLSSRQAPTGQQNCTWPGRVMAALAL
jgi:hypothetical protein